MNIFNLGISELNAAYFHLEVTRQLRLKTFVKKFNKWAKENEDVELTRFPKSDIDNYLLGREGYEFIVDGYEFILVYNTIKVNDFKTNETTHMEVLSIPEFWEQIGKRGVRVLLKTVESILTLSKIHKDNLVIAVLAYAINECAIKLQINLTMASNKGFEYKPSLVNVLDEYSILILSGDQRRKLAVHVLNEIENAHYEYHQKFSKLNTFNKNLFNLSSSNAVDCSMFADMFNYDYPLQLIESYDINYKDEDGFNQLILRLRKEESLATLQILIGLAKFEPLTECSYAFKLIFSDVIKSVFKNERIKLEI